MTNLYELRPWRMLVASVPWRGCERLDASFHERLAQHRALHAQPAEHRHTAQLAALLHRLELAADELELGVPPVELERAHLSGCGLACGQERSLVPHGAPFDDGASHLDDRARTSVVGRKRQGDAVEPSGDSREYI